MKKTIFCLLSFVFYLSALQAQISISNGTQSCYLYNSFPEISYLAVFNGISNSAEIAYDGTGTTFAWYKFSAPTLSISNLNYISPEDATGYILKVDGVAVATIWVIDYQNFLPTLNSLRINDIQPKICETIYLTLDATFPFYQSADGARHYFGDAEITYQTQQWAGNTWTTNDTTLTTLLTANLEVPVPLVNTNFTLKFLDPFADDLDITQAETEITSELFITFAVKNKLITKTTTRDAENEDKRPDTESVLSGSANLSVEFNSNPTQAVRLNQWTIFKNGEFLLTRNDVDTRYDFSDFGNYKMLLISRSDSCSCRDSVSVIDISESLLDVPNTFTPNGDGVNDEFRVAFRSLRTFEIVVYNRWGVKVYESTDPRKGWDGTIGGKKAVSTAYFYVIRAEGTDGKKYRKKGDINLLR